MFFALSKLLVYKLRINYDGLLEPRWISSSGLLFLFWNVRSCLSACLASSLKRPSTGRSDGKKGVPDHH
jgi:hypothetical protein